MPLNIISLLGRNIDCGQYYDIIHVHLDSLVPRLPSS